MQYPAFSPTIFKLAVMKKQMLRIVIFVLSAAILIGVVVGAWLASRYFVGSLRAARPEIAAAIIGAMSTAFVAIAAAVLAHRAARRRSIEEAHRARKVEIYHEFLQIVARLLANQNENVHLKPLKDRELTNFLVEFKSNIMLWGSPKVIIAFREFTANAAAKGVDVFKPVDELYRAIREDIGLSNQGLEPYALVKMYLSDPDELDATITANKALKSDARTSGAA